MYKVKFCDDTLCSVAHEAMEGLGFHLIRTADVGRDTVAWGEIAPGYDAAGVEGAMDVEDAVVSYQCLDA